MEQVRVGFVGAGGIAGRHINDLLGFEDVRIVAISDPMYDRACTHAQRCGATPYAAAQEMLDRETLDAVYVCVPPVAHGGIEADLVERKLPFFVEKPLAVTWDAAAQIAERIAQAGLVTAVGYHWRYMDTTLEAQELLSKNPARLALGYWLDFTPPPAWWVHVQQSGGQMVEQTTHIFDLARVLVGDVTEVYGVGVAQKRPAFPDADILSVSLATLRFADGAVGNMASTCILNWPHRIGLHLFSEGMVIELTEFNMTVRTGDPIAARSPSADPFVLEDRAFIDAVQGKENRIRADYAEALKTHRITTAAEDSARSGQIIRLDAVGPNPLGVNLAGVNATGLEATGG